MKEAFILGKRNSRGTASRRLEDGGEQERQLVGQYRRWQQALAIRFRKTSVVLGELAEDYERDAERIDVETRRRR